MPTAVLGGKTPYYALFNENADLSHLRPFGCQAYAQYYDNERKKMDPKAWRGLMMGYDETNRRRYPLYNLDEKKVQSTVHVTFDEYTFPGKAAASNSSHDLAKERAAEQVGASPEHESVLERPDPVDKLVEAIRAIAKETSSAEPTGWKLLDEIMARPQTEGRTLRSHSARMCHADDDDDEPLYAFNAASILTGEPQ